MNTVNNELPTGITQAMIDEAVAKYGTGNVAAASIPKDENSTELLNVLLKTPGREAVGQYQLWADKNMNKANEILVRACFINADDIKAVLADTGLFLGAVDACASMIPMRKSIVKKF